MRASFLPADFELYHTISLVLPLYYNVEIPLFLLAARMNFITPITLYLFSYYTILTAAFPSSDLQVRDISGRRPSAAIYHCNNRPASRPGNSPLHARDDILGTLHSLCCGRFCSGRVADSPPQSPRPPRKPKTYICRNPLPICTSSQAKFCEKHCECTSIGVMTCGKNLPAFPIAHRIIYKEQREGLCNKDCHCELVEYHPPPSTPDLESGKLERVWGL